MTSIDSRNNIYNNTTALDSARCIVYQQGFPPKALIVDDFDENTVALKPDVSEYDRPLWFPRNIVFRYDERLLDELKSPKGEEELNRLLQKAEPWSPQLQGHTKNEQHAF